jgi:hypothetical protein
MIFEIFSKIINYNRLEILLYSQIDRYLIKKNLTFLCGIADAEFVFANVVAAALFVAVAGSRGGIAPT